MLFVQDTLFSHCSFAPFFAMLRQRHCESKASFLRTIGYEQSLIFLRYIRMGEHTSVCENHLKETQCTAARKNEALRLLEVILARTHMLSHSTIRVKKEGKLVVYENNNTMIWPQPALKPGQLQISRRSTCKPFIGHQPVYLCL